VVAEKESMGGSAERGVRSVTGTVSVVVRREIASR
jgi:hypothetical protein